MTDGQTDRHVAVANTRYAIASRLKTTAFLETDQRMYRLLSFANIYKRIRTNVARGCVEELKAIA